MFSLKNWVILLVVVLLGLAAVAVYQGWLPLLPPPADEAGQCPPQLRPCDPARVLEVIDGDTVKVLVGRREETVRLIGVDTPETEDPRKPVECFGPEAARFTASALGHRQVWLTYKADEKRDKYGRLLAYIWLDLDGDPEPELFNEELVRRGYARVYPFFPFAYLQEFRGAERQARAQGLGLWRECDYEPYSP
ncbi:MAG: thermonuclease family protein [Candidatus Bipolaricaulia bacterium]